MLVIDTRNGFEARYDGAPVVIDSVTVQKLLVTLATTVGTHHDKLELAKTLWPSAEEANARNNLRHVLWKIRKSLDAAGAVGKDYIEADGLHVWFSSTVPCQIQT